MAGEATHPYGFPVPFMKRGGGGPMTASVQRNLLLTDGAPENPDNNQYIPVINSSTYPSVVVAGKRAPRLSLHTCIKPNAGAGLGWSDAKLMNSMLNVDTNNVTDRFAFAFLDEADTRIYDWCRCERFDLAGHAEGGPVACMMGFKARWGEDFAGYGTTIGGEVIEAAPAFTYTDQLPDAGQLTPSTKVQIVGLDAVKGFQLTFLRGQGWRYYFNDDNHPADVQSTMFSGVATFDQEPRASTQIGDTGTVQIKFSTDFTSTTGRWKTTLLLKRDNFFKPITTALGNTSTTFSMFDQSAGGNPAAFAAY